MKKLDEIGTGCKFALTTSPAADFSWSHARLGDTQGGGSYPHLFCGAPTKPGSVYCPTHHKLCYRGPGKHPRSLEEMIYATDQSQYRGKSTYADHTDPIDIELAQGPARADDAFAVERAEYRGSQAIREATEIVEEIAP